MTAKKPNGRKPQPAGSRERDIIIARCVICAMIFVITSAAGALVFNAVCRKNAGWSDISAPAADTEIPTRPDCPAPGVGGIVLPCLGGENGPADPTTAEITVVNVWAWWCGPCREELPYFEELAAQHPEYPVVGVHADHNPGNGAAFLNDLDLDLPSYQDDDNTFAGTLGLPGVIPLTLVFQGTEQLALYPQTFASTADIAAAVDQALAGAET